MLTSLLASDASLQRLQPLPLASLRSAVTALQHAIHSEAMAHALTLYRYTRLQLMLMVTRSYMRKAAARKLNRWIVAAYRQQWPELLPRIKHDAHRLFASSASRPMMMNGGRSCWRKSSLRAGVRSISFWRCARQNIPSSWAVSCSFAEASVVLKHQFSELTIQLPSLDGSSAQPLIQSAQAALPNPVTPQQLWCASHPGVVAATTVRI